MGVSDPARCACACARSGAYGRAVTIARQALGRRAEDLVARRLTAAGWKILARNARTRTGELDLVALEGSVLVFVEVKAGREGSVAGPIRPAHAVGPRKQIRIRRLAREWLASGASRGLGVSGYRFDVVGVSFDRHGRANVDHIRNAF
jgi:putative endonuclease